MRASQLRDLSRKYAAGGLTRDAYVAERTRMIDGMVAGEIEIRYRELEPQSAVPPRKHHGYLIGSALLVGLLLVAVLAYFLGDAPAPETTATTGVIANPPDPGSDRLEAFLTASEWSAPALDALEADWNALTPFQQENARRSIWFRRLKHETQQRIGEQEALLAAGEMDALLRAGRLREFASRLGFSSD